MDRGRLDNPARECSISGSLGAASFHEHEEPLSLLYNIASSEALTNLSSLLARDSMTEVGRTKDSMSSGKPLVSLFRVSKRQVNFGDPRISTLVQRRRRDWPQSHTSSSSSTSTDGAISKSVSVVKKDVRAAAGLGLLGSKHCSHSESPDTGA